MPRPDRKNDAISRALTKILRHTAKDIGLPIDAKGLVPISEILALPKFKGCTVADIRAIVKDCSKQRFRIETREDGVLGVAANQGHTIRSVEASEMMKPVTAERVAEFPVVVHGTYMRSWDAIKRSGLSPMRRQHIHLATGLPDEGGVISGMRASSSVLIYIDLAAAVAAGIPFYVSHNRVILTPGDASGHLRPHYFTKVVQVRTGTVLYEGGHGDALVEAPAAAAAAPVAAVKNAVPPAHKGAAVAKAAAEAAGLSADQAEGWAELMGSQLPAPKGKPTPDEIAARKGQKASVRAFLGTLTPQQQRQLTGKKPMPSQKQSPKASKKKAVAATVLLPVAGEVQLGWDAFKHSFTEVLPFYSPSKRSKAAAHDDAIWGIDRRVFCNLYEDAAPLRVPRLPDGAGGNLMRWDWLADTDGVCSESFFQAAKCLYECDAQFIMSELNAQDAAAYGQSRKWLTADQVARVVALGAEAGDFKTNGKAGGMERWLRGRTGKMARRGDWEDVKPAVMLHICRAKFGPAGTPTSAASAAALKADGKCPLFVEHTANDVVWGDGETGVGTNLLGKTITQVILELVGKAPVASPPHRLDVLRQPNTEIVRYTSADDIKAPGEAAAAAAAPAAEARSVDFLAVLDFEATCEDGVQLKPQEIIEFPTVLVNARTGQVAAEFHHYVTPDVNPVLTAFCTELTGITQDMVTGKVSLADALGYHSAWRCDMNLVPHGSPEAAANPEAKTFLFVTCGDWDLKTCLPQQLQYHGTATTSHFRRWINIKVAFEKQYGQKAYGMTGMLRHLKMDLVGRHHSGIDDCRNIARIADRMLKDGWLPEATWPR